MATISVHNGIDIRRQHNLRNPKVVDKEEHIRKDGIHETWHDEYIRKAYERIFGQSVNDYNDRQKRADRKITDYYKTVKEDKTQNTAYEVIVGVYPEEGETIPPEEIKDTLRSFYADWQRRNPQLEIIGAYYHDDETNKHLHIDYIPVAHGYQRGMETRTGANKAFKQMGYTDGKTGQIAWEKAEREYLIGLCRSRGIDAHLVGSKDPHLDTPSYKVLQQEKEALQEELMAMRLEKRQLEEKVKELEGCIIAGQKYTYQLQQRIHELETNEQGLAEQVAQMVLEENDDKDER